jgi:hypothetical protein
VKNAIPCLSSSNLRNAHLADHYGSAEIIFVRPFSSAFFELETKHFLGSVQGIITSNGESRRSNEVVCIQAHQPLTFGGAGRSPGAYGTHEDESRRFAPGIKEKSFHDMYLTIDLVSLARLFGQGILNGLE